MRIEVAGIPAPQGSKRHVGGGRMVEVSRAVGPWREAVRAETQRATGSMPVGCYYFDGPVAVRVVFRLPRPKSAARHIKWPAKRPDLDKLERSTLDGLTDGGAWRDDGQVVVVHASKKFATAYRPPGATIWIEELA